MPANGFDKNPQNINRNGRPKKNEALTDLLKEYGDRELGGKKRTAKEKLVVKLWQLAITGDLTAIKYIFDRIDGKPPTTIEIERENKPNLIEILNSVHEECEREREEKAREEKEAEGNEKVT